MTQERLACGHSVDIYEGAQVYSHYCTGFGTVTRVGEADAYDEGWHSVTGHGSPYWAKGTGHSLNAERLTCVPCGKRDIEARLRDPLRWVESERGMLIQVVRP